MDGVGEPGAGACRTAGALVLEIRKSVGMTQQDLAERIGTQRHHISRLENDHRGMTLDLLQRIIDATGVVVRLEPNE